MHTGAKSADMTRDLLKRRRLSCPSARAREERDCPPQHQALGITGHTHATAEPEMQHIPLKEKALRDHAAAHFTDLFSSALTKMAILHEIRFEYEYSLFDFLNFL